MKKTYVIILIILIVLGVWFFMGKSNKLEAPTTENSAKMEDSMPGMGKMEATSMPEGYNAPITGTLAPVKEFTVTGSNFSFVPNMISVKKGDVVKINFKNAQGFHDLRIDEFKASTKQIKTGEEETISFIADKTGSFEYYCSVGSHRAMGMKGTLKVE